MGDPNRWDELENAIPSLAGLYPEATKIKVKPMGWLERMIGGGKNLATTDLDNTINYNKAAAQRDGVNPDQLLAHELQHVRQNNSRSLGQNVWQRLRQGVMPWESRPDEIDAMAVENRPQGFRRTTDIQLPASAQALAKGPSSYGASATTARMRQAP